MTFLEAFQISLSRASCYNPGDVVAPAAVLWTDADGQMGSGVRWLSDYAGWRRYALTISLDLPG